MGKGFIGGAFVGLLASTVALVAVSVVSELPAGNAPPAPPQTEAPAVAPGPAAPGLTGPGLTGPDLTGPDLTGPDLTGPDLTGPDLTGPDLTGSDEPAPDEPTPDALAPDENVSDQTEPDQTEPDMTAPEVDLSEPTAPEVESAPEVVAAPEAAPQVAPTAPTVQMDAPIPRAPSDARPDTSPSQMPVSPQDAPALASPDVMAPPSLSVDGDTPVLPNPQSMAPLAPEVDAAPVPPLLSDEPEAQNDASPDADQEAAAEPALPGRLALDGAAATMPEGNSAVRINRAISDDSSEPMEDERAVAVEPEAEGGTYAAPALVQFAATHDRADSGPVLSMILMDLGAMPAGIAPLAVSALPFPVTIAIDPAREGATELMQGYRRAGMEVVAIAGFPEGALPSDVEVSLQSVFATLPETVALLDPGSGGLQSSRAITDQTVAALQDGGRGLVTAAQGLNMALQAADAAAVPAGVIFRDLDAENEESTAIRRALDQATFRARQDSNVILLARVRPDTLSALTLWGMQTNASEVAFAPVSVLLKANAADDQAAEAE